MLSPAGSPEQLLCVSAVSVRLHRQRRVSFLLWWEKKRKRKQLTEERRVKKRKEKKLLCVCSVHRGASGEKKKEKEKTNWNRARALQKSCDMDGQKLSASYSCLSLLVVLILSRNLCKRDAIGLAPWNERSCRNSAALTASRTCATKRILPFARSIF